MLNLNFYKMNNLRNKVQLIGNAGMEPEIKDVNGSKLAKLSIATNETYTNKSGERVTDTQWHNIVAWGKTAELIERFVTKGKEMAVEGKLNTRSYEDQDGNKRYVTEIIMSDFLLLGGK